MDTLIYNVTALLMDENKTVLKNAFVLVRGEEIAYVGQQRPEGDFCLLDGRGQALMPGFVNCHTHVPMTLLRGYGGGCDLQTWLHDYIFPAEARLTPRSVAAGTMLGLAEMIAGGVTCIADMYMHTGTIAQCVADVGLSANLSCGGVYFGPPEDFSPDQCADCRAQEELTGQWHGYGNGRILVDASIHAEYTSTAPLWRWMAQFAQANGLRMHVHVSETQKEHKESLARNGLTPVQALDRCGVWDNGGIAAHCVYTTPEDWEILKERGVSAVHNPYSNLKLGSGVAPVPDLCRAGVNVALGTDGVSSHNSIDPFADMKLAAILHGGVRRDPMAVSPYQALEMATANGGTALGRKTGRIQPGWAADLILVDLDTPHTLPCHDLVETLVYSSRGSDVTMNMARGQVIYQDGEYRTLDWEQVKREVRAVLPEIFPDK